MKTVIKHGNKPEYLAVCDDCGCAFTYNDKDIRYKDICDKHLVLVDCPECGAPINAKNKSVYSTSGMWSSYNCPK